MKITCIEVESPYRYRAYMVGKKPLYDIQNNTLFCQSDSVVLSILKNPDDFAGGGYTVYMSNGEHINIESGQLIVHTIKDD